MQLVARNKVLTYTIAGVIAVLVFLSFFLDIGYIVTIAAVIFALVYTKKSASGESEEDILKAKENAERIKREKEIVFIKEEMAYYHYEIANDPLNFDANRQLKNLESRLKALIEKNENKFKKF